MNHAMTIDRELLNALIGICRGALPGKAFGVIAGSTPGRAEEIYPMTGNLRESNPLVNRLFESYGEFYRDRDRGFCFDPGEFVEVERRIRQRGQRLVAVYHSHRVLPAEPTPVDRDMHISPDVFMTIVSIADPAAPTVEVFRKEGASFVKAALEMEDCSSPAY